MPQRHEVTLDPLNFYRLGINFLKVHQGSIIIRFSYLDPQYFTTVYIYAFILHS